jgi:S-adenosylmethionine synthetase
MSDQISDSILDAVLTEDPYGRVACETLVTTGLCVVAGEISTKAHIDFSRLARDTICEIGYTDAAYGIDGKTCGVIVSIDEQSPDIAMGVDKAYEQRVGTGDPYDEVGAGDQGMMFGYACDDTDDLMPIPIWLAHKLARRLTQVRKERVLDYLRPDGKTQVSVEYEDGVPVRLETVLISTQHAPNVHIEQTMKPDLIEHVIRPSLPPQFADDDFEVFVNPTGSFELGGPHADCGLTGRKIIVDTYGGMARHGGGAFSGKDPTKVDRSAAYAVRQIAKSVRPRSRTRSASRIPCRSWSTLSAPRRSRPTSSRRWSGRCSTCAPRRSSSGSTSGARSSSARRHTATSVGPRATASRGRTRRLTPTSCAGWPASPTESTRWPAPVASCRTSPRSIASSTTRFPTRSPMSCASARSCACRCTGGASAAG